jgi:hypothetical protein
MMCIWYSRGCINLDLRETRIKMKNRKTENNRQHAISNIAIQEQMNGRELDRMGQ